jgi:thiamine-phosphate pyrophosphorylase
MPPASSLWPRRGLYAITPDDADTGRLLARVEPMLRAGACVLQYRNKAADAAGRRAQALALSPLCAAHRVPLIINDDWRLAADVGAAGAHLGGDDGDVREARAQAAGVGLVRGQQVDAAGRHRGGRHGKPLSECDNDSPAARPPIPNAMTDDAPFRSWMCVVCGFIYDEAAGLPEEGIAPGTRWEDIPDDWCCPDCGVTKDDFEMVPV